MKNTRTNQITFTQAKDNTKAVVADKYVAHAIYTQNKALVEELGGSIVKGVEGFRAEFTSVKKAKAFIEQAITGVSKSEYNKSRKTAPKKVAITPVQKGKGKAKVEDKSVTVTIDGVEYTVPKSALVEAKKPTNAKAKAKAEPKVKAKVEAKKPTASRKGKGVAKTELSEKAQKHLEFMKASVLNRAASAYSIANGGQPITYDKLGKSKTVLAKYLPKAKADLLKSSKWAKAVELGITADMLD